MAGRKRNRIKLRAAQEHRDYYVRVVRRPKKVDQLDGYVVGLGESWVLLTVDLDGLPNGFTALRLRDIKRIERGPSGRFVRKSLKAHDAWPPVAPGTLIELDGGALDLVESAALAAPLVTIHPERDDPGICFIGRPAGSGRRKLLLHEVNPSGRWVSKPYAHRIDWITRIEFGGIYETNLAIVAGEEPEPSQRCPVHAELPGEGR